MSMLENHSSDLSLANEALKAGVTAIVGGVIGYMGKRLAETIQFVTNSKVIRDRVNGEWKGDLKYDEALRQPLEANSRKELTLTSTITLRLTLSRKTVSGTGEYAFVGDGNSAEVMRLEFTGGLLTERFLQLNYKNSNPGITQFGAMTFELHASDPLLEGYFSGYGPKSKMPVGGMVTLRKCAS